MFDDIQAITENQSIRDLTNVGTVLSPPPTATGAVGRPLVNLSFAMNYAFSGTNVFGYHIVNLLIHLGTAFLLFGVLRRTFKRISPSTLSNRAEGIAMAVTLLWEVHPLLTESVTAVGQRSESMMGLFMMAAFYAFTRAEKSTHWRTWKVASIFACLLGMATKEVTFVCPILLLLYDCIFFRYQFSEIWRQEKWFYGGLLSTYALLLFLVVGTAGRNSNSGI